MVNHYAVSVSDKEKQVIRIEDQELDYSDEQVCLYEDTPFTGVAYEEFDGLLIAEVLYQDGARSGLSKFWYPSGQKSSEEHFQVDARHGPSLEWHENGSLKRAASYEYGIVLNETIWDAEGTTIRKYELQPSDPGYELLTLSRAAAKPD